MFTDPKNRPIASARSRGRVPAIAVASLTTAWARRTKSTIANTELSDGKISGKERRMTGAPPPYSAVPVADYSRCAAESEPESARDRRAASAGGGGLLPRRTGAREQSLLHQAKDDVSGSDVDLLNERCRSRGRVQAQIAERGHFATALAGEAHRDHPDLLGRGDRPQNVWRAPRGRDRDQHVTLMPEGAHLAFEHALIAIIVGDSGKRRRVGGQRDRRRRRPIVIEPAHQLA